MTPYSNSMKNCWRRIVSLRRSTSISSTSITRTSRKSNVALQRRYSLRAASISRSFITDSQRRSAEGLRGRLQILEEEFKGLAELVVASKFGKRGSKGSRIRSGVRRR